MAWLKRFRIRVPEQHGWPCTVVVLFPLRQPCGEAVRPVGQRLLEPQLFGEIARDAIVQRLSPEQKPISIFCRAGTRKSPSTTDIKPIEPPPINQIISSINLLFYSLIN